MQGAPHGALNFQGTRAGKAIVSECARWVGALLGGCTADAADAGRGGRGAAQDDTAFLRFI